MRHLYRNIALILVVMLICAAALWPPEKNLRLGKDLAGGVSITYGVELAPGDPPQVVDQVIEVLSKRVNPNGLFEISFIKQGRDRIEVSMPLPSKRVQELRNSLDAAIEALGAYHLDSSAVERALRAPASEQDQALDALMTTEPRTALLEPVRDALAAATEARAAYEAAKARGDAPPDELTTLVDAAGAAEETLDQVKRRALTSSVTVEAVRSILRRSRDKATIIDDATKKPIPLDSPFDKGIASLRARIGDLPGGTAAIDAVIAANTAYLAEAKGLDDPQDLERMLQGSGVLEFHIAVRPGARPDEAALRDQLHQRGPSGVQATGVRWYPVNKATDWFKTVEELKALEVSPAAYFANGHRLVGDTFGGEYFLLLYDEAGKRLTSAEGDWRLTSVSQTADQLGRPAVVFNMDPAGGSKLSDMTEPNVNEPMAVMLDGRVFTAPNIKSRLGRNVTIEGSFSPQELAYLQQTLKAGSLSARLSERPLSLTRLAPELGRENLEKGIKAGWIALILVAAMMIFYYFLAGLVAAVALLVNVLVILGVMSLNRAAFTLPGIAGIILTFGMAVDSNVLIYERLREELLAGNDLKTAIRIAYARVMNTIVDSNVTTLIACVVLAYTATQEIKGFAITLGIGVVATMFAALFVTRVLFAILVDKLGIRTMRQLPMVFPAIDRFFHPNIDWVGLRPVLWSISALLVGTGIFFVVVQGDNLLDTEFRGGTAVDLRLKDPKGEKIEFEGQPFDGTLRLTQVQDTVKQIGQQAIAETTADPSNAQAQQLEAISTATVIAVGRSDGITSDWFRVKTTVTDEQLVLDALMDKFADVVGTSPPLTFTGSAAATLDQAPVHTVQDPILGRNDWMGGRTDVVDDVGAFVGGVAIVLQNIAPEVSETELISRVEYQRTQGENVAQASRRTIELIVIDGSEASVKTAVILVRDPLVSALFDESKWKTDLAATEWEMTRVALAQASTTASVETFSAEVAATFRAKAIVATAISLLLVMIYIWVRFGSLRYSMAAIVATFHDMVAVIGVIALSDVLSRAAPQLAVIGIQPYKIDLGLMAAILTIIGYSLNDTIVILDRVRENRGKLPYATRKIINDSVNQTMSRTIITGGSTLASIVVMFLIGGEGLASFNFALFWGIIIGTFSSIAIAAPIVYTKRIPAAVKPIMEAAEAREMGLTVRDPVPSP